MDEHLAFIEEKRLERVKAALERNGIPAAIVQSAAEVAPYVKELLPAGCTVAVGGSVTLAEAGVLALLRGGDYDFLDREAPGADAEAVLHAAFGAQWYLSSANALTEDGKIYQMDGRGNRVAAILYGPRQVLLVVGRNKIVPDEAAARRRNHAVAAPANCRRLGISTPCGLTGQCANCTGDARICVAEVLIHRQLIGGRRLSVLLVNEELGY